MVTQMTPDKQIHNFIADWFARFDRLDPIDVFLTDLHPLVEWDMPDADPALSGHERVRAWYAGVLNTLLAPTEHHVSNIKVGDKTVSFTVLFCAQTYQGDKIEARVQENWRFEIRPDGRPLITHYSARLFEEASA